MRPRACPLCGAEAILDFHRDAVRDYRRCTVCALVFVPPEQHPTPEAEKKRYALHRNSPDDPGYRRHLSRLASVIAGRVPPGSTGLDFGSGPEPVLASMLEEAGYEMTLFDRYFAPAPAALEARYDFITAAEVVEHLHEPGTELERLWSRLNRPGVLAIMTCHVPEDGFARWHYKDDFTHVCFFSAETFQWLSRKWNAGLAFPDRDVAVFRKSRRGENG